MASNLVEWNGLKVALLNREQGSRERLYHRLWTFGRYAPRGWSRMEFVHELLARVLGRLLPVGGLELQEIRDLGAYCHRAAVNLSRDLAAPERPPPPCPEPERPEAPLIRRDVARALHLALAQLSKFEERVFRLAEHGNRPEAIMAILENDGVEASRQQVAKALKRARANVRKYLQDHELLPRSAVVRRRGSIVHWFGTFILGALGAFLL